MKICEFDSSHTHMADKLVTLLKKHMPWMRGLYSMEIDGYSQRLNNPPAGMNHPEPRALGDYPEIFSNDRGGWRSIFPGA